MPSVNYYEHNPVVKTENNMKSHKLRILHIIPDFGTGGAEMLVKNLLLSHDRDQFEAAACSLFPHSGTMIEKDLEKNNISVFYLNKQLGPDPKLLLELWRLFKTFKPDVIHTHRHVIRYTLLPSLICRVPVKIHTVHNIAEKETDSAGKMIHWLSFRFFGVQPVGVSKEISKTVQKLYKIKNVFHIYNGIPIEHYRVSTDVRQKIRDSLNISEKQFVIIHIGRFSPQKNHRLLIEGFSRVVSQSSSVSLLLVGDGALRFEIDNFVKAKGLDDKVKFLGLRNDIPELLFASDLFVLSSDWEGLPIVVLEAMASGKPVVATASGGVPELIVNEINGLLVKSNDANAISEAILKVAQNPEIAKTIGEKGREMVKNRFDVSITTKQYENLYMDNLKKYGKKT